MKTSQLVKKGYKYKLVLLKKYFDTGYGMTNYLKYFILAFGLYEISIMQAWKSALIVGVIYGVCCFIFGWLWFKYGWVTAEIEVNNQFDLFVREMRNFAKNGKV